MKDHSIINNLKYDIPAGIVVFFVALPLCLGISLASGAPLISGIIAGIVGGFIVGIFSNSSLGVSGPAAGLAVIVFGYVEALNGRWDVFVLSVVIAGVMQLLFGFLRLGTIAYYFPSSVIKGMLSGIGIIIILKQIPFALGEMSVGYAPLITSIISIAILLLWDSKIIKNNKILKIIPGPLLVVVLGIIIFVLSQKGVLPFNFIENQIVNMPIEAGFSSFMGQLTFPDFASITNPKIYLIALVIAIVASVETLLCVEATDKLDPERRVTPANKELKAQGVGNIVSGLLGGLPVTQVIVRSSANINFGARTKFSTIVHGFFLFACVISIPNVLNMIPLSSLACILIIIGYKLAHPSLFKEVFKSGIEQFAPFIVTIIGMVALDLLSGVGIGLAFAILFILKNSFHNPYEKFKETGSHKYQIVLAQEVTFLNKEKILRSLDGIPANSTVTIDGSKSKYIHFDILEIIDNFKIHCDTLDIELNIKGIKGLH